MTQPESANGLRKTECMRTTIFHSEPYKTTTDVEFATTGWGRVVQHEAVAIEYRAPTPGQVRNAPRR